MTEIRKITSPRDVRIKEIESQKEVKSDLCTIILRMFHYKGQAISKEDAFSYAESLFKDISQHFGMLDMTEVANALKLGLNGEFGEYFGLNPSTFYDFLKKYKYSKHRTNYLQEKNKDLLAIEQTARLTESEIYKRNMHWANEVYADYLATGKLTTMTAHAIYDFLDKKGSSKYLTT